MSEPRHVTPHAESGAAPHRASGLASGAAASVGGAPGTHATPVLQGDQVFREGVQVYVNRSDEAFQDFMGRLHRHDFIEIAYVISGSGIHQVGDARYATEAGDLFIINDDVPHGFFSESPTGGDAPSAPLVTYNCVFKPAFIDSSLLGADHFRDIASSYLFRTLFPEADVPEADLRLTGTDFREIGTLFATMHREYQEQKKGYADILRAMLVTLLIRVFRLIDEQREAGSGRHAVSDFHRRLVGRAIAYMQEHASGELRLEDVAMQTFVSKNHFSRLFREVTGVKFSDHVQGLRIEEAVRLLGTTDKKVADIALLCGFRDLKHFYDVFRKRTGRTPGAFRGRA